MQRVEVLDLRAVARRSGLAETTVRTYHQQRRLPEPNVRLGQSCGWYGPVVDAWQRGLPPPALDDVEPLLDVAEVARLAGMGAASLRALMHGGYGPPVDVRLGSSPGFYVSTVERWLRTRPGQGARTDLIRSREAGRGSAGPAPAGRRRASRLSKASGTVGR